MSIGNPIVFSNAPQGRQFKSIFAVSSRRDDPDSFEEDLLQELIEKSPDVLPVREFLPSTSGLFSLGREVPVDIGGSEGSIDNLLVTNDGYMVIVETKLYRNPEATRNVIAQILQYGMALGRMPVMELEARIGRGQNPALRREESIADCVVRLANDDQRRSLSLADDFEEALERHLRRGEMLLLVVSDGIRISVERVTHWLNEQGSSSPFKFGLVELKFYTIDDQQLVIPRAVLKTREVSRHVVVVDINPTAAVSVAANVTDEFQSTTGGKMKESRLVKAAPVQLTKSTFLQKLPPEDRQAASQLIEQLEIFQFELQGTPATMNIGFTTEDGEFHRLSSLDKSGAWTCPYKKDIIRLGAEEMLNFHRNSNKFGRFYREDQMDKPDSGGCAVKYREIVKYAAEFASFLDCYRTKILELIEQPE